MSAGSTQLRLYFRERCRDVGAHLAWLAEEDRNARDMSVRDISRAVLEVTACMPVYRTYTNSFDVSSADREHIAEACRRARVRNPKIHPDVYDFLERVLTLRFKRWMPRIEPHELASFCTPLAATQRADHGKGR